MVMEYAGSRTHIGLAMGCLLETLGLERVALPVMGWDTALLSLGRRAGWAEKQEALPGTFKIINSNALVESLRPWLAESGGEAVAQSLAWDEAGGRFTLEGPGGELSFDPGQFVQLLLGLPAGASEAEGGPNPPEVWAAPPLPWTWPCGLNYT